MAKEYEYFDCRKPYTSAWDKAEIDNFEEYFESLIREKEYYCDADVCGIRNFYFVVKTETGNKFYKVSHSWYIDYDPEWEIFNEYETEELTELPKHVKYPNKTRDWLNLKKR